MTLAAPGLQIADAAFRDAERGAVVIVRIKMSPAHTRFAEASHGG